MILFNEKAVFLGGYKPNVCTEKQMYVRKNENKMRTKGSKSTTPQKFISNWLDNEYLVASLGLSR